MGCGKEKPQKPKPKKPVITPADVVLEFTNFEVLEKIRDNPLTSTSVTLYDITDNMKYAIILKLTLIFQQNDLEIQRYEQEVYQQELEEYNSLWTTRMANAGGNMLISAVNSVTTVFDSASEIISNVAGATSIINSAVDEGSSLLLSENGIIAKANNAVVDTVTTVNKGLNWILPVGVMGAIGYFILKNKGNDNDMNSNKGA